MEHSLPEPLVIGVQFAQLYVLPDAGLLILNAIALVVLPFMANAAIAVDSGGVARRGKLNLLVSH